MRALAKKEREQIFCLFTEQFKLKFSDIEKRIGIRSNMIAYHLEQMRKEGLLEKKGEFYILTKEAQKHLPAFSHIARQSSSPLPVVLVAPMHNGKVLLIKRMKRPYKGYWSLIGGKILLEESLPDACRRKVQELAGLDGKLESLNAIVHERVEEEGIIKHGFILFFVKATVKLKGVPVDVEKKWFSVKSLGSNRIIPSDLWLLQNKLNSKIEMKTILMHEKDGELSAFRID